MTITNIEVFRTQSNDKGLIGICSFLVNMDFIIRGVKIFTRYDMENHKVTGIYLLYPKMERDTGPIVHPVNKAAGLVVEQAVEKVCKAKMPEYF